MISSYILLVSMFLLVSGDVPYKPINGKCNGTDYNSNDLCCTKCDPGMYAAHSCNTTSNTICTQCPDGTFTSIPSHTPACLNCRGKCGENQVETKPCSNTHDRVCDCKPGYYCGLKSSNGCRLCIQQTKCNTGYGVYGYSSNGDVICKKCPDNQDKCNLSFNQIDVEINMYPVNETSCNSSTGSTISTSELTITLKHDDCTPEFIGDYYSVVNNMATSGFFTNYKVFQDLSKQCKINLEIKCNSGGESKQLTPTKKVYFMPHSETVTVVGDCLSNLDVYIIYINTNAIYSDMDVVAYHTGSILNVDHIAPRDCDREED
ncbi:TNF alpha-receptor-like-protein [Murmansk poxvirus]|uniref:TNF-alpha-receptor-like protein n=1 Tax=Murmansk poxvirus TaxID=2025359 RepID=A0A223FMD8_9POXV|nr:TNF-alpha-receptor-like protein [Murmansk poxvirus]YP_009408387.1 TNF alpha-receptor-like-protein [Murmansk poxvirus]AST09197.1 TNF-alpha-receptor-like protein [Murmansk poxvirus]AST09400.1 TNF alpha-receptor-like-protein [Murmansk poxvirus]